MHPVRLLAKCTARGVAITGAGFGGTTEVTAQDVAGALGMGSLSPECAWAVQAKFCADNVATEKLKVWLTGWVEQECVRKQLTTRHSAALAFAACWEFVWQPSEPLSARRRSALTMSVGGQPAISKTQMAAHWMPVITLAVQELTACEERALRHLWRQFDHAA